MNQKIKTGRNSKVPFGDFWVRLATALNAPQPRLSELLLVESFKDYIKRNLFFRLIKWDSLEYIFVRRRSTWLQYSWKKNFSSVALLPPLISWHQHHLFPSMTCITWHMKSYTVNNRVLSLHERGNHFHFFSGRNNFYFHFLYYCVRQRQQHQYWWVLNLDPGQTNHKYKKQHFFQPANFVSSLVVCSSTKKFHVEALKPTRRGTKLEQH